MKNSSYFMRLMLPLFVVLAACGGSSNGGGSNPPPAVVVSINDANVDETAGTATFTVSLTATSDSDVTLQVDSTDGTATAPGDYTALVTVQVTIVAGQSSTTVDVTIIDDALSEGNETYTLTLSNVSANATLGDASGLGTIGDDESATVQTQQVFPLVALSTPTGLVQAPGDTARWFAIGQAGLITVFDNDPVNATGSTFLDITARVQSGGETGLLGIAFHPNFATNGEVFVSYTAPGPLTSVISRFRSFDGNLTLDPTSEEIILTMPQDFSNHNGGDIHFGPAPDNFLFIGFGDGGSGNDPNGRGQDTTNWFGTFLRIDVDIAVGYDIPPTNPFAGNTLCVQGFGGANCPEIFAWGLRNPWRFSFDTATGQLWTGDVGQGAWEEVDRIDVSQNYGWKIREGAHCRPPTSGCSTAGLTDPITEYDHSQGFSITGGYVYRGTVIPGLVGQYIFGDFGSGRIWRVPADSPIGTAPTEILDTAHSISAFGEGVDGELYVVDYGGTIHQIIP